MSNLIKTTTITNYDNSIELSSLLEDDGSYTMTSICFKKENTDDIFFDNDTYIDKTFLSFCHRYMNRMIEPQDLIEFKELIHLLNEEYVQDCIDIIGEAKKLKML